MTTPALAKTREMPQLITCIDDQFPVVHELGTGKITIGRNSNNGICINDSCISATHAEIVEEKGGFRLRDLGSSNGTRVNGFRIEDSLLKDGDEIVFGQVKAVFLDGISSGRKEGTGDRSSIEKAFGVAQIETKLASLCARKSKLEAENQELEETLGARSEELERIEAAMESTRHEIQSFETEKLGELKSLSRELEQQNDEARENLDRIGKEISEEEEKCSRLRSDVEALQEKLDADEKELAGRDEKKNLLGEELEKRQTELTGLTERLPQLEEKHRSLEEAVQLREKTLVELEEGLTLRGEEISSSEAKLSELKMAIGGREAELEDLEQRITSRREEVTQVESRCAELERGTREWEERLGELERKQAASREEVERIRNEARDALGEKEKAEHALGVAREEMGKMEEQRREDQRKAEEAISSAESTLADVQSRKEELEGELQNLGRSLELANQQIAEKNDHLSSLNISIGEKQLEAERSASLASKNDELARSSLARIASLGEELEDRRREVLSLEKAKKSLEERQLSVSGLIRDRISVLRRIENSIDSSRENATELNDGPPLRIIDPEMRSLVHYYRGSDILDRKTPLGIHALAAATRGSVHRDVDTLPVGNDPILVLLSGVPGQDGEFLAQIAGDHPNRCILACWRNAESFESPGEWLRGEGITGNVAGIISVDHSVFEILDDADPGIPHLNLPPPYPLDFEGWKDPVSLDRRTEGIFLAADGFSSESALHRARIDLLNRVAQSTNSRVTIYRQESGDDAREQDALGLSVSPDRVTERSSLEFEDYLQLMSRHRLVVGFAGNQMGGDILGDALITQTAYAGSHLNDPMVGGIFPALGITENEMDQALQGAVELIENGSGYSETIEMARSRARQHCAPEVVREKLFQFIESLPNGASG